MKDFAYCLTHESLLFSDLDVPYDDCVAVYAPVPEMDMSDDWVDNLPAPSEYELILMDRQALAVEADFIGEQS